MNLEFVFEGILLVEIRQFLPAPGTLGDLAEFVEAHMARPGRGTDAENQWSHVEGVVEAREGHSVGSSSVCRSQLRMQRTILEIETEERLLLVIRESAALCEDHEGSIRGGGIGDHHST